MDNKKKWHSLLLYIGVPIVIIVIMVNLFNFGSSKSQIYSEILGYFKNQRVTEYKMNLGSGDMTIKLDDGSTVEYSAPSVTWMHDDIKEYVSEYDKNHPDAPMKQDFVKASQNAFWETLLVQALWIVGSGLVIFFIMRKAFSGLGDGGKTMTFGKAKIKNLSDEKRKATFNDVAGADEEKEELKEIVDFLKNPQKYNELGARIPKGVLLVGPPGTGKTLLARAVAGEAGVPFFSISGSDFVEMFVGVGASRVRDLFEQAKKNSPCIVFIDEIGTGLGGGHDEREQTLNQLLVEMDGFGANEGVIMIAATNRPDVLDPALMRPGRFDRQVIVNSPDIKGREDILKVHSRGKPLAPDVELSVIAKSTAGFTGADLENLLNEAALLSARRGLKAITMKEIEESTIKVVVGTEKKSHVMTDKEKNLTSYHEAGHAISAFYCKSQDPVHQISIIPRGLAGGFTMQLPSEDKSYRSKNEMKEEIVVLLGGRVAEALILGDISTGASSDIKKATEIANSMVTKYGMSEKLGPVAYNTQGNEVFIGKNMGHTQNYSEAVAAEIDREVKDIISEGYKVTESILKEHIDKLHEIAKFLFKNEKMTAKEFDNVMRGLPADSTGEESKQSETEEVVVENKEEN